MLSALLDRLWAPTTLYFLCLSLIYSIRNTISTPLAYGLFAVLTLSHGHKTLTAISTESKLDKLGKRAGRVKDYYSPYGLLTLFRAIWYFNHYRNHEFWWKMFLEGGHSPKNPYTVESLIIGERIIFTADEENF